ncbi:MAG: bifunctional riboflavin kinase/FAD synthetase [Bacteroidales bacterium]|nr:bifunctional riboflavin kinase/FAD synthetase [Bacteroidales bacterium]
METFYGHKDFKSDKPVVTLGMFDGVHRGHRALLNSLISRAESLGTESVVMTLDPHPRIVLSGNDSTLRFLTSLEEKRGLMEEAGIDKLVVIPFSLQLSRLHACDFVKKYLVDVIGVQHLILGFDHHFGYRGYSNAETVTECAARYGFSVDRLGPLKEGNEIISSTTIRELIADGSLDKANSLLGYPYLLKGKVVEGRKIGRMLGYPTANIEPDYSYKLIPADGVYAVEASLDSGNFKAMLYIGPRPTIERNSGKRTIEVNIFDFDNDIYRKNITVKFMYRLRGDKKFSSREQLLDQIIKDKAEAMRLLGI